MYVYIVYYDGENETEIIGLYASEYKANQMKIQKEKEYRDVVDMKKMEVEE